MLHMRVKSILTKMVHLVSKSAHFYHGK